MTCLLLVLDTKYNLSTSCGHYVKADGAKDPSKSGNCLSLWYGRLHNRLQGISSYVAGPGNATISTTVRRSFGKRTWELCAPTSVCSIRRMTFKPQTKNSCYFDWAKTR